MDWPPYAELEREYTMSVDDGAVSRTPFADGHVRQARAYTSVLVLRQVAAAIAGGRLSAFRVWARANAHTWFDICDPFDATTRSVRVRNGVAGISYEQVASRGAPRWLATLTLEGRMSTTPGASSDWPAIARFTGDYRIEADPDVARTELEGGAVRQDRIFPTSQLVRHVVAEIAAERLDEYMQWAATYAHAWFDVRDPFDGGVRTARVRGGLGGISYEQVASRGAPRWLATLTLEGPERANQLPLARAGGNQVVPAGGHITLDGSASSDPDGSIVAYLWSQLAGTPVVLSDVSAVMPTFVAPSEPDPQVLEFELTVTDDRGDQAVDGVTVVVAPVPNQPPVARAGVNQAVAAGADVTLDGSASSDPDGSIVAYLWSQLAGTPVALSDAAAVMPTFVAPSEPDPQDLEFELTVTDDRGHQATGDVTVSVAGAVTSFRFDGIENLRVFATFEEGSDGGRWEIIAAGSTASGSTGPGGNSAGPYAATDSSFTTEGLDQIITNSTFDLRLESNWPAATRRVLRLRCAVMGAYANAGEGLLVQGMATGGAWTDIALIRGWAYSANYSTGDEITDYSGATITCAQDGGWVDVDTQIPDDIAEVRLRLSVSGGSFHQHDVALWSAELLRRPLSLADWVLPDGRTQHALMLCSAAARDDAGDDIYRHPDNPPAAGALIDGSDIIDFPGDDDSRVTRFRDAGSELVIHDNPDATLLRPNFEALTDPQLHTQTLDASLAVGVSDGPNAPLGGNFATFGRVAQAIPSFITDLAEGDRFILAITSETV